MNYSTRNNNKTVKFIIIHYTGMLSLQAAYKRLICPNSNVSCHYLSSRKGIVFNLLSSNLKAWHAGKSKWKGYSNLNDHSIGIELENRGHDYGYQNFTIVQYKSLNSLISSLCKSFRIQKNDILGHSDIAPNRKIDPGEKFKWNLIK